MIIIVNTLALNWVFKSGVEILMTMSDPTSQNIAESLVGTKVGERYKIVELISSGPHTSVFKAEHVLLDKPVAIKVMFIRMEKDQNLFQRFKREASTASKLRHVNICALEDFWFSKEQYPYIVMEFIPGKTLVRFMAEGERKLEPSDACGIVMQVCEALEYAHSQGIIHRDITPRNIMLYLESAKLIDFGLAKSLYDTEAKLSLDGTIYGTPTFLSPEQCQQKSLDFRCDIYSLGCVLFTMLAGYPPFREENIVRLLRKHIEEMPDFEEAQIAPKLVPVISKAMAKEPDERFQSAKELKDCLRVLGYKPVVPVVG